MTAYKLAKVTNAHKHMRSVYFYMMIFFMVLSVLLFVHYYKCKIGNNLPKNPFVNNASPHSDHFDFAFARK
jgi:hypothetical protein